MEKLNMYDDLKKAIKLHFSFLKEFGFPDFEEHQLAHEYHFETNNGFVKIDINFEITFSTPVWLKINHYSIDDLEPQNAIVKQYTQRALEKHDEMFGLFLKAEDGTNLHKKVEQYGINDRETNNRYLLELSEIIKRHPGVLHGDMELIKANIEIRKKEQEQRAAAIRIEKQIYTLEYCFLSDGLDGSYDSSDEFATLDELKQYLAQHHYIKIYRILDWNMKPVS